MLPDERLSDVTHRVDAAPTDNAATVIPIKDCSESQSKEGPLVIPAREQPESSSREGPFVIPAKGQPESSSKDGSQFPLLAPVVWIERSEIQDQTRAHPGSQLHSARALKRAANDRSQKAAAVIPLKDWSEPHSKEGSFVIPAREQPESSSREGPFVIPAKGQPESSSRDGFQFPLPAPVAYMNCDKTRDQPTAYPGLRNQYHPATRAADFPLQNDTTTVIPAKEQPESSSRDGDPSTFPSSITFATQQNEIEKPSNTHPTFRYRSTRHTNLADYQTRHKLKTPISTTPKPNFKRTLPCESMLGNDVTRQQVIST